ncbi:MAG TPA: hypothetical protein VG498_17930, partial [Terriglobales bacterium]|nr:hypothetical protein [Terriglobales bacterium]
MKGSKDFAHQCSRSKAGICVTLILALFTVYVQPGFAVAPPAPKMNAQLLGGLLGGAGLLPVQRFIVRDTKGLLGLNLTCLVFGCKVLEGIGDPDGQLFVVTVASLLSPLVIITNLLSGSGITNVETDQAVNTQSYATVGTIPSYLTDRKPVSYYGTTVWEGYLLQTPNQIIHTAQTQAAFGVTGNNVRVAIIDTGVDPNNTVLQSRLVYG